MDRIAKTNIVGIIILFAAFAADIIFFYVISTVVDILGRTGFLVYICLLEKIISFNIVQVRASQIQLHGLHIVLHRYITQKMRRFLILLSW